MLTTRSAITVLSLALLLGGNAQSQEPPPQAPQIQTERQPNSATKSQPQTNEQTQAPDNISPGDQQRSASNTERHGDSDPQKRADEAREYWPFLIFGARLKVTDSLLALFTFVLVLVGIGQALFLYRTDQGTHKAADAAKESADAAKIAASVAEKTLIASQRAWIRIDEIGLGGGGLAFDKNGASVSISFKITNVGNSPAINVSPHARLVVLKSGGPFALQEQQRLCCELRRNPFGLGFTLFPAESFPSNMGLGAWSLGVNVSGEEVEKGIPTSADGKHVVLSVFGCIDYTFPADPTTHHQTGFIRELRMRGPFMISPTERIIPIDRLLLIDSGIGLGQYAD
jgi:hypothetical protein